MASIVVVSPLVFVFPDDRLAGDDVPDPYSAVQGACSHNAGYVAEPM